jgi:hypothetical protein
MASGSSTALLLLRAEALQTRPNLQVYRHKATKTRLYKVYYYYDNNKGVKDKRAFPVCLFKGEWYQLLQDKTTGGPKLGGPVPELHQWDDDTVELESSIEDTESDDVKEDKQLN